jgi:hypothetical protein
MKNIIGILSIALFLMAAPAVAAEKAMNSERLQAMAASAKTPAEHATVAKHYRLAAESFENKARRHEAEAARLQNRPQLSFNSKWPAMSPKSEQNERTLAMEARRAAQENLQLADRHYRLSIEAQHTAE